MSTPGVSGPRNVCPDCHNVFIQPFKCTTCGAQKLYDATLTHARERGNHFEKLAESYRRCLDAISDRIEREYYGKAADQLQRIIREERAKVEVSK